jgi:hypothetical protein
LLVGFDGNRVGALPSAMPRRRRPPHFSAWIKPELAALVKAAPDGPEWLHEIKLVGQWSGAVASRGDPGEHIRLRIICSTG